MVDIESASVSSSHRGGGARGLVDRSPKMCTPPLPPAFLPHTTKGRALFLALLCLLPLISYHEDIFTTFDQSAGVSGSSSSAMASEQFNSYKLNTPLFEAVKSDNLDLVRNLLEGGVDAKAKENNQKITFYNVNAEDPKGLTPLIEATLLGNQNLVELLLLHGARAQPSPGFRHTALRAACLTGNPELIKLLLDNGADPNAQSEGGRTPLMGACYLRPQYDEMPNRLDLSFNAVTAMLKDLRTDVRIKNDYGETALDLCRERGYNKSMAYLRNILVAPGTMKGSESKGAPNRLGGLKGKGVVAAKKKGEAKTKTKTA